MIALPVLLPAEPERPCEDAATCEGKLMLGAGRTLERRGTAQRGFAPDQNAAGRGIKAETGPSTFGPA